MHDALATVLTGLLATAAIDLWSLLRKRAFGVPAPDFGLVGRWLGHMPRGRFRHAAIARAEAVRGERVIGWTAHYAIGIGFAALLVAVAGLDWLQEPRLLPALVVGLATVAAPFLLMQPGMGAGIAARLMPRPNNARLHSLLTHAIFGLGLYAGALSLHALAGH